MKPYERRYCPDCGAFLQSWGDLWRCPWTRQGDAPPDTGDWACGRAFDRRFAPDVSFLIHGARPGITSG